MQMQEARMAQVKGKKQESKTHRVVGLVARLAGLCSRKPRVSQRCPAWVQHQTGCWTMMTGTYVAASRGRTGARLLLLLLISCCAACTCRRTSLRCCEFRGQLE